MTNETMKDDERAAFEAWASEALEAHYDEQGSLQTYDSESAWLGWQARAATPQSGERATFDENEWRAIFNSTRTADVTFWQFCEWVQEEMSKARAAAPQTALTEEQRFALSFLLDAVGDDYPNCETVLRELLTQAQTERMSDTEPDLPQRRGDLAIEGYITSGNEVFARPGDIVKIYSGGGSGGGSGGSGGGRGSYVATGGPSPTILQANEKVEEPPDGDKEYWKNLYLRERQCRQQWQTRAVAPQAALTANQCSAIKQAANLARTMGYRETAAILSALLAQAPK